MKKQQKLNKLTVRLKKEVKKKPTIQLSNIKAHESVDVNKIRFNEKNYCFLMMV